MIDARHDLHSPAAPGASLLPPPLSARAATTAREVAVDARRAGPLWQIVVGVGLLATLPLLYLAVDAGMHAREREARRGVAALHLAALVERAGGAHVDERLDPWGTPYALLNTAALVAASAGPDRVWSTSDDVTSAP